jgi:FkbH-like protein
MGLPLVLYESNYDSVAQQVFDEDSGLYEAKPDFTIFYLCVEKLYVSYTLTDAKERKRFAETKAQQIFGYWKATASHTKSTIIQYDFIEKNDWVFGHYALLVEESFLYQVKKLNRLLYEGAAAEKNVLVFSLNCLASEKGYERLFSNKFYDVASMPISMDLLPLVSEETIQLIKAKRGSFVKAVILDLDNTLWGGIISEDGLNGIRIGELGNGRSFLRFQRYLKELSRRGILLCVVSKNDEDIAKEPFEKHPEMVLTLSDITLFIANWKAKSENIKMLQRQLNIAFDAMVFLDDSPFEREEVKKALPEIVVPELPSDPSDYVGFLQGLNLFETTSFSEEDRLRPSQYQTSAERANFEERFASIDDYLASLDMVAEYSPFQEFQYPRIAQLSQRSNQFNLRTIRYDESQIAALAKDPAYRTWQFCLKDRFGNLGLISALVLKKEGTSLFVESFFMSCRVLGRDMEKFIANIMVETAKEEGCEEVIGEYRPTKKNGLVADLYPTLGFQKKSEGLYHLSVANYVPHRTHIQGEKK